MDWKCRSASERKCIVCKVESRVIYRVNMDIHVRGDANHILGLVLHLYERSTSAAREAEVDGKGRSSSVRKGVAYKTESQFNYRMIIDIHMRGCANHIVGLALHPDQRHWMKDQK